MTDDQVHAVTWTAVTTLQRVGASSTGTELIGADLRHADLTAADLSDAVLIGVVYHDAALAGTDTRPRSGDENPGQASHHSSGPGPPGPCMPARQRSNRIGFLPSPPRR
ncbi:pentapeptide repeat-containing protein [Nocardia sp. NPDC004168]|uniref:pentapeptide repeat-containing protein n=1 Tax=Nocardia sp. NPDC004168 TaxID=3154452 RepID=UPI0033B1416C